MLANYEDSGHSGTTHEQVFGECLVWVWQQWKEV